MGPISPSRNISLRRWTRNDPCVARTTKAAKYGLIVQLKFLRGSKHYWALYAHLSQAWVTEGQQVADGQVIASTGLSGNAEGEPPHLHFEIATDGSLRKHRHNYIDPSIILGSFLKDQPGGEGVVRESSYELDVEDIDRYINRSYRLS